MKISRQLETRRLQMLVRGLNLINFDLPDTATGAAALRTAVCLFVEKMEDELAQLVAMEERSEADGVGSE